jgi:hypothetical protein
MENCPVCGNPAKVDDSNPHNIKITCSQCAKFAITDVAINIIPKQRYPNWSHTLQEYIRMNQTDGFVEISTGKIRTILGF